MMAVAQVLPEGTYPRASVYSACWSCLPSAAPTLLLLPAGVLPVAAAGAGG